MNSFSRLSENLDTIDENLSETAQRKAISRLFESRPPCFCILGRRRTDAMRRGRARKRGRMRRLLSSVFVSGNCVCLMLLSHWQQGKQMALPTSVRTCAAKDTCTHTHAPQPPSLTFDTFFCPSTSLRGAILGMGGGMKTIISTYLPRFWSRDREIARRCQARLHRRCSSSQSPTGSSKSPALRPAITFCRFLNLFLICRAIFLQPSQGKNIRATSRAPEKNFIKTQLMDSEGRNEDPIKVKNSFQPEVQCV